MPALILKTKSDSLETMRLVEKAYESSKTGGEYL